MFSEDICFLKLHDIISENSIILKFNISLNIKVSNEKWNTNLPQFLLFHEWATKKKKMYYWLRGINEKI